LCVPGDGCAWKKYAVRESMRSSCVWGESMRGS